MSEMSRHVRLAVVGLMLSAPGLTYWILGDLSEAGADDYLDRMWPTPFSEGVALAIGLASGATAIASVVVIMRSRDFRIPIAQAWSLGLLIASGIILATGVRVMTAGVGGANLGAGLYLLLGFPLCIVLIIAAVLIGRRSHRAL